MMNTKHGYTFGGGEVAASLEDLVRQRERMPAAPRLPSGYPSDVGQGLTFLGAALAQRTLRNQENRINEQIETLDPTGEVVRALMERGGF